MAPGLKKFQSNNSHKVSLESFDGNGLSGAEDGKIGLTKQKPSVYLQHKNTK